MYAQRREFRIAVGRRGRPGSDSGHCWRVGKRAVNSRGASRSAKQLENPEGAVKASQSSINAGNVDRMVSLYEPEALFVSAPGQVAVGSKAIRETFAGLLAAKPKFELNIRSLHEAGDIALECFEWQLECSDPDGNPMVLSGTGSAVFRR